MGIKFLFPEKPAQQKNKKQKNWPYPSSNWLQHCFHCYSPNQKVSVILLLIALWFSIFLPPQPIRQIAATWILQNPWRTWVMHNSCSCILICHIQESTSECTWDHRIVCELVLLKMVFVYYYFHKCLFKTYKNDVCSFPSATLYQENVINFSSLSLLSSFLLPFLSCFPFHISVYTRTYKAFWVVCF